jgi:hypothetical protein
MAGVRWAGLALAAILIVGAPIALHAQVGGSIAGTIKDSSGGVVPESTSPRSTSGAAPRTAR